MAVSKGHSLQTRNQAQEALNTNRPHSQPQQMRTGSYEAIITAIQEGGYQVGLLDEAGNICGRFDYVRAWPDGGFEVDEQVWLVFQPGCDEPKLQSSGGHCSADFNKVGVLVD